MWPDPGSRRRIPFPMLLRLLRPRHSAPALREALWSHPFFVIRSSRSLWLLQTFLALNTRRPRLDIRSWSPARRGCPPANIAYLSRSLPGGHKSPRDSSTVPRRWDTFDGTAAMFAGSARYLRWHRSSVRRCRAARARWRDLSSQTPASSTAHKEPSALSYGKYCQGMRAPKQSLDPVQWHV